MAKQEFSNEPIVDATTPVVKTPSAPVYGKDGRLSYESMVAAIRHGGSVSYKGRILSSPAHLPSELEYASAGGDRSAVASATAAQEQKIAELQAELDRMKSQPANPDGLDALKVDELHDRAKAAGIEGEDKLKKQELIDALRKSTAQS